MTPRTSSTRAETAESSSKAAPVSAATIRASVVLPTPGGPYRISDRSRSSSIARRSADPSPSTCVWPTSSSSVRGRSRCGSGACAAERSRAASAKRSLMPRSMLRPWRRTRTTRSRSSPATAPATTSATSTPTRCSRSRRRADEWVHRDELLFQTVHQSSELWLKLAWNDVEAATRTSARARSRRRCACCAARRSASATPPSSSTCSSTCRRGSTRRSARCSATAAASTRPAGASCAASCRRLGQAFHALREQAGLSLDGRLRPGAGARGAVPARRGGDRARRADQLLADPALQGRRARDRRLGRRHPGHARGGARPADPARLLPGAVARPQRAHGPVAGADERKA